MNSPRLRFGLMYEHLGTHATGLMNHTGYHENRPR